MKHFFHKAKDKQSDSYLIEIKDDNVILHKDTETKKETTVPTLVIPEHAYIDVLINQEKKIGETLVHPHDQVDFVLSPIVLKEASCSFSLTISEDHMNIFIKKSIDYGKKIGLQDVSPTKRATIGVVQKDFAPVPSKKEEIYEMLKEINVVGEIDENAIEQLCLSEEEIELIVLKGQYFQEGIPAFYELLFENEDMIFVKEGDVIALFHEEIPAVAGMDIYGSEIYTPLSYSLPSLGEHVQSENESIIALKTGRLIWNESDINIIPQLIINHDLNGTESPIIYHEGDVYITGKVLENSFILTSGAVFAQNGVYGSTIFAKEGVFVTGNTSSSRIYAGSVSFLYKKMVYFLDKMINFIEHHQFFPILSFLSTNKMEGIESFIEASKPVLEEEFVSFFHEMKELFYQINSFVSLLENTEISISAKEELFLLNDKVKDKKSIIQQWNDEKSAPFHSDNITNSYIYASDDIVVSGEGTYLSHLESMESIDVKGKINGGLTISQHSIKTTEFKSFEVEDAGLIVIEQKGSISIGKRHPDTLITIDDKSNVSYEFQQNVHFTKDVL